jgi:LYR motif-containing protein 4
MAVNKLQILQQYRNILKSSKLFQEIGIRKYIERITREDYRKFKNLKENSKIEEFFQKGEKQLELVRRQGKISSLYITKPSVIELNPKL